MGCLDAVVGLGGEWPRGRTGGWGGGVSRCAGVGAEWVPTSGNLCRWLLFSIPLSEGASRA